MNTRKSLYDVKSFYNRKAVLKASFQGMRYQVEQYQESGETEPLLRATVWPEPFSFEATAPDKKTVKDFPYEETGLDEAYEWLCSIYEERRQEWLAAKENPAVFL